MPDVKISALPSATTPLAGTEVLPIVQGGITEQVSIDNLTAGRSVAASGLAVDANSSGNAVRITQTGSGNALVVEDSANPDATPFVVNADGRAIVGTTASVVASAGASPFLQVHATGAGASVSASRWANDANQPFVFLTKSRSTTVGTYGTIVQSGDVLGSLTFSGDDGVGPIQAALISSVVDGTPGTNDMPGRLVFSTTADGASSPTERMRIDNAGRVGIGITTAAGTTLRVSRTPDTAAYIDMNAASPVNAVTTSSKVYYYSVLSSSSNSGIPYTVPNVSHFSATAVALNSDTTVTNQYGFSAGSALTGATNNYGFHGNIAAGTGRYNFYAAGTAQNLFSGDVLIFGAGAIGYATGSGGAVTQATSRTTGVTLNKTNGAITLVSAAGTTAYQSFTVTNSTVAATDVIRVCQKSGTDKYIIAVTNVSAGSFEITFATTGGTTTEQPVFNFSVTKAVTS